MPFSFRKRKKASSPTNQQHDFTSSAPQLLSNTAIRKSSSHLPKNLKSLENQNGTSKNASHLKKSKSSSDNSTSHSGSSLLSWLTPRKKTSQQPVSVASVSTQITSGLDVADVAEEEEHVIVVDDVFSSPSTIPQGSTPRTPHSSSSNGSIGSSCSLCGQCDSLSSFRKVNKSQTMSGTSVGESRTKSLVVPSLIMSFAGGEHERRRQERKNMVNSSNSMFSQPCDECGSLPIEKNEKQTTLSPILSPILSSESSPRFLVTSPEELDFYESENSPLPQETNLHNITEVLSYESESEVLTARSKRKMSVTSQVLSDPELEDDIEWLRKFDVGVDHNDQNPTSGMVDLNTVKKKRESRASRRISKLVSALSFTTMTTDVQSAKRVKSPTTNSPVEPQIKNSDDTSVTGGALIINDDEPVPDRGRFSRSFKDIMLGRKSLTPTNVAVIHAFNVLSHEKRTVEQKCGLMVQLPHEIKRTIMEFLEFNELLTLRLTCMEFLTISYEDEFWERKCFEHSLDFGDVTYKRLKQLYIENQLRVAVIGEEEVGKTLLIRRCSNNPAHLLESFVLDRTKHFDTIFIHDEEPYYIYFREYGRENKSNLKTSREDIFFVCFSILDKKSFTKTKKWINMIRSKDKTKPIILVGMKSDLRDEDGAGTVKLIKVEQGENYKNHFKLFSYKEVSNKTRIGIPELMIDAINARRIQMEKFYNYDKTLGTEAEMEDISEDIFNDSDEEEDNVTANVNMSNSVLGSSFMNSLNHVESSTFFDIEPSDND